MNILIHGTLLNPGGISHHTKEFSKFLSKYHNIKIRNFNIPHSWVDYTGPEVYKNLDELEEIHHKMLYQQSLWNSEGKLIDLPLSGYDDNFEPDFHLIMAEANHYYHYQEYNKPVIVYFPWETTKLNDVFTAKLKTVDYVWVPSQWQLDVLVNNGIEKDKIKIVHEGVDPLKYRPEVKNLSKKFTVLHIGTWEYRKSTYEIVRAFINVFGDNKDVELRLGINNKFREQDGPHETFMKFGIPLNSNIVFLDTLYEDEYVNEIKNANLYLSCARSEGWNLPLIQSMACGVPAIYSKCGGQMEFTQGYIGTGIDIVEELPAQRKININGVDWCWDLYSNFGGNLYEPNYQQIETELKKIYNDWKNNGYKEYQKKALKDSIHIIDNFNWDKIAQTADKIVNEYTNMMVNNDKNEIYYLIHSVSFGDTLASTPTLRYLSKSHEKQINVVTHNKGVFNGNPYIKELLSFDEFNSLNLKEIIKYESFTHAGRSDKNGIEKKFSHIDIRQIHAMDLGFQLTPSQMTYDYYPSKFEMDIKLPEEYVVLHVTTNWPNRTWSDESWVKLIDWLKDNKIFTILIGSGYREELHQSYSDKPLDKYCPTFENLYGLDLTNQGSMSDMWWVINGSKAIVTMDSGPLHLAGCTNVKIIQLGSAINPELRAPYRYGRQDYNYTFVGGTCNLFCNSNLFYNVKEWGHINAVPPMPHCLEEKPTFECHPTSDKVISIIKEIYKEKIHDRFDSIVELVNKPDKDKLHFNYKVNSNKPVKIEVIDVNTGLKRGVLDDFANRIYGGDAWWAPSPGVLDGLGSIILNLYVDDIFYGSKKVIFDGNNHLEINGKKLKFYGIKDNSYSTYWEIFINKDYEREIDCNVNSGDVVLDIGANYGFFTLYSLKNGASKVYSVEPFMDAYNHINDLSKELTNIKAINAAISEENGETTMFIHDNTSAINCTTKYGDYFGRTSNEVKVKSLNINTLLESISEKIDFLKVDCEGSEYELFKTIDTIKLKSIKKMVIETHGDEITEFVIKKLKENNFIIKPHDCSFGNKILFAINNN